MTAAAEAAHASWVLRFFEYEVNRNKARPRNRKPIAVFGFIVMRPETKVVKSSIFQSQPSNTRHAQKQQHNAAHAGDSPVHLVGILAHRIQSQSVTQARVS